jgi:nucleotide-binding universal stress UspA family protein
MTMTTAYTIPLHGHVLAALDVSVYSDSVTDHAAWAAGRLGAPLRFLHALDRSAAAAASEQDLSGSIGLDAGAELLAQLASVDEQRARLGAERGRLLVANACTRARAGGVSDVEGSQRHGGLVETLTDVEADVRLFVLGKRGEHADFARGHLGGNLERVVRAVHRPLLVASRAFKPVQRFLIAFDGSPTTRKCVDMVAASPLFRGLPCVLLAVGSAGGELDAALASAASSLVAAGFDVDARLLAGDPETVIASQVRDEHIDLLVMGAYGHRRIRQLIVGSTTTALLRSCPVPVLLLR